jgi:hypothetical protein
MKLLPMNPQPPVTRMFMVFSLAPWWWLFDFLALGQDLVEQRFELIEARAGDDDGVAPAVGFLGDFQEAAAVVLTEFDGEALAFDLEFADGQ